MTSPLEQALARELPDLAPGAAGRTFADLGVDSFAMLELRVAAERALGARIADAVWVELQTPAQLLALAPASAPTTSAPALTRQYVLGTPQLSVGGLSEAWLFRELGDMHEAMITRRLGAPSHALRDGNGDRLDATFTRIQLEASAPLASFREDEAVALEARLEHLGADLCFSRVRLTGEGGHRIDAALMSSFTRRGDGQATTGLPQGQPAIPAGCPIPELAAMPELGVGYHTRRAAPLPPTQHERGYQIAPYQDLDGAGQLHVAAYPAITDACELAYVGRGNAWAFQASTLRRDVCYVASRGADDELRYRVHARVDAADAITLETSLARASDGALMAYVVTHKVVRGG